jgi:hypothetical protein
MVSISMREINRGEINNCILQAYDEKCCPAIGHHSEDEIAEEKEPDCSIGTEGGCGMHRTWKAFAIIALFTIAACSNSMNENDEELTEMETASFYFTGTIKEMYEDTALVDGTRGKVLVTLSVNNEETFHVGDKVRVGYNGTIMESNPARVKTLSVELVDE